MIQVRINKQSRQLSTDWDEITIRQAIAINNLTLPESIQTVEAMADPAQWVQSTEAINYAAKVFGIMSGFTEAELSRANPYDIVSYFNRYLLQFVVELHVTEPISYKPVGIKEFSHNGTTYKMPESLVIDELVLPLHSTTAIEFTESSNIMALIADMGKGGIKYLPLFVATYCRPDGEKFDEVKIQARAKEFETLPMSVAWEVFFCIQRLIAIFTINILNYTQRQIVKHSQQLRFQAWIESVTRLGFIRWLNRRLPVQLTGLN